jgi:hypothetical protein
MTMERIVFILMTCLLSALFIGGCGNTDMGKVDQGRVIEFNKEKGTVTFIRDLSKEPGKPDYTYLPPITYQIPADIAEMGADPKAGYRMKLDTKKNQIIIFDPASQGFKTVDYKLVEQQENVERESPLVFDKAAGKAKSFPVVDKDKKTVTVYSGRQKTLTIFSPPDEYLSLPAKTWDAGDEVRVYYKTEGKSVRLMNISRTDIFKK